VPSPSSQSNVIASFWGEKEGRRCCRDVTGTLSSEHSALLGRKEERENNDYARYQGTKRTVCDINSGKGASVRGKEKKGGVSRFQAERKKGNEGASLHPDKGKTILPFCRKRNGKEGATSIGA